MCRTMPILCLLTVLTALSAADQVPLGHPDFYPSDARPVGYRGDGSGCFPGATPVLAFWEGTPALVEMSYIDRHGREQTTKSWTLEDDTRKNIVWKTEMPGYANSQPIVVGDRVFTYSDPHTISCVDIESGEILWSRDNIPWELAGKPRAEAEKLQALADIYATMYDFRRFYSKYKRDQEPARAMVRIFKDAVLPRITAALHQLDPDGADGYDAHLAKVRADLDAYLTAEPKKDKKGRLRLPSLNKRTWGKCYDQIKRRLEHLGGIEVPLESPWGRMIGWSMTAPVSDGTHVYVYFPQGQTACYDLDGTRVWGRWVEPANNRTPVQSPLLCGDVLIDMQGGAHVLRGLDKRNGKALWEAPTKSAAVKINKGGYYVGGHALVHLENGEASMDVVVTHLCNIIRVSDGREVGHLAWGDRYGPAGGAGILSFGNLVFKRTCGDGGGSPFTCYELELVDEDTVEAVELYANDDIGGGYQGKVITDTYFINDSDGGQVIEPRTGKIVAKGGRRNEFAKLSTILAGTHLFHVPSGSSDRLMCSWYGRKHPEGWTLKDIRIADFGDPTRPRQLETRNILGGRNLPRMPWLERYAPELHAHDAYWSAWAGKPSHFMHVDTGMFPAANRLLLRSVSHLYCIGDPDQPYTGRSAAPR